MSILPPEFIANKFLECNACYYFDGAQAWFDEWYLEYPVTCDDDIHSFARVINRLNGNLGHLRFCERHWRPWVEEALFRAIVAGEI